MYKLTIVAGRPVAVLSADAPVFAAFEFSKVVNALDWMLAANAEENAVYAAAELEYPAALALTV